MFSYILLFILAALLISPRQENLIKKYFYAIALTSSVFAYNFLGLISLILISISNSKFPILLLSLSFLLSTIFIDKKNIKNKFIYLKNSLISELIFSVNYLKNKSKKIILIIIFLLFCLITISSIGPINHPDSLDYHVGYPYQYWLKGKFFIDGGLHQALLGIGDYANLSFIQENNIWLIRYLQIITLPIICLFLINKIKDKFFILVLLSSPVIIQWSTIGKPLFLGESALAIAYLIWKESKDKFSKNLLLFCIFSCLSLKISSLIVIFPIAIDIIVQSLKQSKKINLRLLLKDELEAIFCSKLTIISIIILCSIFISRQIISGNFLYPLLTDVFNKDDILITEFSNSLSSYRRDNFFPINLFLPINLSDISHTIGPSFLILIILKIISFIKKEESNYSIFFVSFLQISLLLLFCQGRGDYYIEPIILILYSLKDFKFDTVSTTLKNFLFSSICFQLIIVSTFIGFSIKQTILTIHDYEKTMNLTTFGFSPKKYINYNLKGNLFYTVGRDVRFYYPANYISRETFERCLLNNDQNFCLENLKINQVISGVNYIRDKKDFKCDQKKLIKGSRIPFNRKEENIEICERKLSK